MFYLYQSNRLESLAALFCKIQQADPLAHPLKAEEIVVQSQGMRRYLSHCLAKQTGVAANLHFSLPAGLTWSLMRQLIPDVPAMSPFSPEVMRWRLMSLFRSREFQTASEFADARAALADYLNSGESADYQLAGQLADMFDQYLVYRPQWIDAWQEGQLLALGEEEIWQAALWRYLDDGRQSAPHRVALWEQLLEKLSPQVLPQRYFVFGISTMAPMYLQLLQKISEHCDVFVFALNPSEVHWGNVIEAAQILKGGDDVDLSQSGHPLLASLGKQGRDFFDFLSEIELETPVFDDLPEKGAPSLLHTLQHDIQTLTMPSENPQAAAMLDDGSIQIVSAHSPLRELQILKERLLQILAQHPDWQPHDIAVLTPNIEPYSPFIEAVFGRESEGAQALPYSISDVKLSRRQPLLHTLAQTLELLESRFEVDKVLPLLESELIRARFEWTADDIPLLHDTIAQLNVHWGIDGAMRGAADNLFTWQQALERLVLGWMLPENDGGLWQNISAWHSDVNRLGVFSRFAAFIRILADTHQSWQQPCDVAGWVQRVRDVSAALLQPADGDQYAAQQFEQALTRWQQEAELAGFDGLLPQHTVIRHLSRFLNSESQAGFLRGGITFCSMVPMRSLPFKVLCLLGLNDGDFPRNTKAAGFDLIAKHPKKGDRARRDDDRYLFLEALISAREILYVSYVGRSIRNDDELAPSALLGELVDTVAAMSGRRSDDLWADWVRQHPLQPFSLRYFTQNSDGLFSTRADYAEALNMPSENPPPFFSGILGEASEPWPNVTYAELAGFWKNPLKYWLKRNLGWREPYHDAAWDAVEPFEPQQEEAVADAYLQARRDHSDFAETAERIRAQSLLPSGELGGLWQQDFQTAAKRIDGALLASPPLPPYAYEIECNGQTLSGSLNHLSRAGQIIVKNKTLNYTEQVELLLQHLVFCAVRPSETESGHTYLISHGETSVYEAVAPEQARQLLAAWLEGFNIGQDYPLPFFARVSWQTAEKYLKEGQDEAAWEQAQKEALSLYHGDGKRNVGQKSYTEVNLVFGRDETVPVETPLFQWLVENVLAASMAEVFEDKKPTVKKQKDAQQSDD